MVYDAALAGSKSASGASGDGAGHVHFDLITFKFRRQPDGRRFRGRIDLHGPIVAPAVETDADCTILAPGGELLRESILGGERLNYGAARIEGK
jgi:hypothetical protein